MTQISKGDTFTDGQQVTGARLNQLVDASTLLVGAITDQTAITAATVASDDNIILSDTSATALRKATVSDILGSSLPVVASSVTATSVITSTVNAGANSDIVITPYDAVAVTGKAFSSSDGITATVTSTAHGLIAGMVVNITATVSAYSGQYQILVPTVDTFTYSVLPTTTASSGTCSYIRKASERIAGNLVVSGEINIAGNETIGGNLRVVGTATINGKTPMTTETNLSKYYVKSGQASGVWTVVNTEKTVYTTPTLPTPPSDETWIYEITASFTGGNGQDSNTRSVGSALIGKLYKGSVALSTQTYSAGVHMFTGTSMTFTTSITSSDTAVVLALKVNNVYYPLEANPYYIVRLTKVKTTTLSDNALCI